MMDYIGFDPNGSSSTLKMMWKSMHEYRLSKISLPALSSLLQIGDRASKRPPIGLKFCFQAHYTHLELNFEPLICPKLFFKIRPTKTSALLLILQSITLKSFQISLNE